MKKSIFILGLAVLGLSACKKEYTCACSAYSYDLGILGSMDYPAEDYPSGTKISKSDATEWCEAWDATNKLISSDASCELK
jgi:hypothetical protein